MIEASTASARRRFESLSEVKELVARFENASLTRSEWDHRAHLTVAAWYLLEHGDVCATEKVTSGIRHFNRVNGIEQTRTGGYHETMTLFWLAVTDRFLAGLPEELSRLERINRLVEAYEGRVRLVLDYYSRKLLGSWTARLTWVEPDLRLL